MFHIIYIWERAKLPHVLHRIHQFLPSVWVGGDQLPYWVCLPKKHLEMFSPEMSVSSGLILLQPVDCCLQLRL